MTLKDVARTFRPPAPGGRAVSGAWAEVVSSLALAVYTGGSLATGTFRTCVPAPGLASQHETNREVRQQICSGEFKRQNAQHLPVARRPMYSSGLTVTCCCTKTAEVLYSFRRHCSCAMPTLPVRN